MDDSRTVAGVVLMGTRGVGKTRLASEAISRCECERRWTAGTAAGRAVPLGAFVEWMPDGVDNPTHATERVIARLVGPAASRSVVIVVDDVHLLDDASAFLLHRVVDRKLGKLLLTTRTGVELPNAVAALWRATALQRIELAALGRQESASLVASALGGLVDPAVTRHLWTLTQGNARYLRAIVEHHLRDGQLRRDDGMWTWSSEPAVPDPVCELVEEELGRLTDDVAEVLDLLAVAQRLPARVLVGLMGTWPVEEAERRSLIVADDAPEPIVRLAHPLYGEVRRTRLGRIRLRRLRGTVAAALSEEPEPSPAAIVQRALLLVDSDLEPAPDDLLRPAQAALWRGECGVSLRFARRALLGGGGWRASIACADALTMAGRSAEAEIHLVGLDADGLPPEGVTQLAASRALSLLTQSRIRDAIAAIDEVDTSKEASAVRALVLACAGRDTAAIASADDALGPSGIPEPAILLAVVAKLLVAGERGDLADIEESVCQAADIAACSWSTSFVRFLLAETHVSALLLSGSHRAAEHVVDRVRDDDAPPVVASWVNMMSGAVKAAAGYVDCGVNQIR